MRSGERTAAVRAVWRRVLPIAPSSLSTPKRLPSHRRRRDLLGGISPGKRLKHPASAGADSALEVSSVVVPAQSLLPNGAIHRTLSSLPTAAQRRREADDRDRRMV